MPESILQIKSYDFAILIINSVRSLQKTHNEFILTKQLLRSGTAIGASISEAQFGQSRADFSHKLSIALKEANETRYWLKLLHATNYIDEDGFLKMLNPCTELIRILVSSIKTSKLNK
jgi:four helix bundle protein